MAQGSGFRSQGALRPRLTAVPSAPTIRSGAAGAAQAASTFAGLGRQLNLLGGHLIEQERDRIAEEETQAGEAAGIRAAREGEPFQEQESGFFGSFTRDDDAFNAAAREGYAQGLKVRIDKQSSDLLLAHEADPDGYIADWDKVTADTLKSVPPDMHEGVTLYLQEKANKAEFALAKDKRVRVMAEASLNVRGNIDQIVTDATNLSFDAGDPGAAIDKLSELTIAVEGAVETGLLTPAAGASILAGGRDEVFISGYMGAYQRNPSLAFIEAFSEADTPELARPQKDALISQMSSDWSRRQSAAEAEHRRLGKEVENWADGRRAGLQFDPAVEDDLGARVAGTEFEADFNIVRNVADRARDVSQRTPAEQAAELAVVDRELEALQDTKISAAQTEDALLALDELNTYRDQLVTSMEDTQKAIDDGRTIDRAAELGLLEVTPLDFSSAEGLVATLNERTADAEFVERHWTIPPGNVFTEREVANLAAFMQPGAVETETQVATLALLNEQLGQERMGAVLAQVAEKEPEIAFAAGLPTDIMANALNGRAQLQATPQLVPGAGNLREGIHETYGEVLALNPNTRAAAVETARWLYAAESAKAGDLSGDLDTDRWDTALETAVGGIVEWDNDSGVVFSDTSKVIPPRPGMTSDQFVDLMDGLSSADLAAAGQVPVTAQGQPVTADLIRRLGKLRSVSDGVYAVTIGDFDLIDQNGRPYVLDLGAVLARPAAEQDLDDLATMTLEQLGALDMSALTQEQALAVAARAAEIGGGS